MMAAWQSISVVATNLRPDLVRADLRGTCSRLNGCNAAEVAAINALPIVELITLHVLDLFGIAAYNTEVVDVSNTTNDEDNIFGDRFRHRGLEEEARELGPCSHPAYTNMNQCDNHHSVHMCMVVYGCTRRRLQDGWIHPCWAEHNYALWPIGQNRI